ncbi:MAG TPA: GNAT family N-acetyltransferase [Gemmatimonadales bacterium]|nr:GNAT family N-acetyltransferase [Gemmatimonadales bacterium]
MLQDERRLTIRDMDEGEEFAAWLNDLTERFPSGEGDGDAYEERHLVLTDEIGDWIGGLRYAIRGGVAQVLDIGVLPKERHQGHAHRLLAFFEERAAEQGAHLIEFWTDHVAEEGFLEALGWHRVLRRPGYVGGRTWYLLEKRLNLPD